MSDIQNNKPRKPWYAFAMPAVGKSVRGISRLLHHGGSALPGQVVERLDAGFLARTLNQLPLGVVLVSGTNGKTTTTRMVASMLQSLGLRVFTNPTGSNFTRGVVSQLVNDMPAFGATLDADIAVLELDEAYAVKFVQQVQPRYALLLNVMRDQLDRFGEIDNTARMLGNVAQATQGVVVLNREDARIAALAQLVPEGTAVSYFGLAPQLRHFFPSDDDMATTLEAQAQLDTQAMGQVQAQETIDALSVDAAVAPASQLHADVVLDEVGDHHATLIMDGQRFSTDVKLEGVYNLYNAAAALSVVRAMQKHVATCINAPQYNAKDATPQFMKAAQQLTRASDKQLVAALAQVTPAFGRGEVLDVNGSATQLLLVKNPMGFRLSLASFPPQNAQTMICINDEYADGRDMSWLWDVDFTSLRETGVAVVSGVRAWDMALRLAYDDVPVGVVEPDIATAIDTFAAMNPGSDKHIFCTYTAMLQARSHLATITQVADAGVGK